MSDEAHTPGIEAENAERVRKLQQIGAPMEFLASLAVQTRLELVVDAIVPKEERANFELAYELQMAQALDAIYEEATRPRLVTPE